MTKKSIKELINNKFPSIRPTDANYYASSYYNFIKVKNQIKAKVLIDCDVIVMHWEKGNYKIKMHDDVDRNVLMPLLLN